MAKIQSAKDILINNDILGQGEEKRHPKHEFQAYAYRLASDLNDLIRLQLYMRLAKTVQRSLLEQAYAYTIDSNSDDKGKIFLWKVKQLRKEIEKKKIQASFDYKTVIKHTTTLRNTLAQNLVDKSEMKFWDSDHEAVKAALLRTLHRDEKQNVLIIGLDQQPLLDLLLLYPARLFGIDWSANIAKQAKKYVKHTKHSPKPKLIGKDLLKKDFEKNYFDLILFASGWNIIPLESEKKIMKRLQQYLKKDGSIIIHLDSSSTTNQTWKTFEYKKIEYLYFKKQETEDDFVKSLLPLKLEVKDRYVSEDSVWYLISD